jgi:hypothetical protein
MESRVIYAALGLLSFICLFLLYGLSTVSFKSG